MAERVRSTGYQEAALIKVLTFRQDIVALWARRLIEEELCQAVELNDDQSAPSMYDLRVGPKQAPLLAIECVGAIDDIRTETWNVGPANSPWILPLNGDWAVTILRAARIKQLRKRLGPLLRRCEERNLLNSVRLNWDLKRSHPDLFLEFEALGIGRADCYRGQGEGKVFLTMEGIGGWVDKRGTSVPGWIGDFLRARSRADVLFKLAASGATERHVFVVVDFGGAPWAVESYLSGPLDDLLVDLPPLPPPVTGIWLTSTLSRVGVRWTGVEWKRFAAVWRGRKEEADTIA